MKGSIDIFFRSEIKLDETVSNKQFEIQGYKTFREDRNKHGAGVMLYLNENILCRVLDIVSNFNDLETIFLEFSLRNKTWFCLGCTNLLIKMIPVVLIRSINLQLSQVPTLII